MKRTLYKSKFGNVNIVSEDDKLLRLDFYAEDKDSNDKSAFNDSVMQQLNEYFDGRRKEFDIPIKYPENCDFFVNVWKKLQTVSFGKTTSYKELAKMVNNPNAARAVGNAMRTNPIPIVIPCHRVLKGDGKLGGFSLGLDMKKRLLQIEQIDGFN